MKDLELKNSELFEMVKQESLRQIRKWGIQDRDPFEWLAYTVEEVGELSCAISEYCYRGGLQSEVVKEAIHTATLSLKIAEMFIEAPMACCRMKGQPGKFSWALKLIERLPKKQ